MREEIAWNILHNYFMAWVYLCWKNNHNPLILEKKFIEDNLEGVTLKVLIMCRFVDDVTGGYSEEKVAEELNR